MRALRLAALLALPCAVLAGVPTAEAQQRSPRPADPQASMVEQLNQMSLDRARQGLNSPTPGPDTTANLNRMSDQAAQQGRNMNQAPMPFR